MSSSIPSITKSPITKLCSAGGSTWGGATLGRGGDHALGNLGPQNLVPTLSLFCRNASTDNGSNILCMQLAQENAQCSHGLQQNGWPSTVGYIVIR